MENTEIERKWLMGGFPPLEAVGETLVEQSYLSFEPVVRLSKRSRPDATVYKLTIKGEGRLTRTEVEFEMSGDEYAALLPLAPATPVRKSMRYYTLPSGLVLECSLVDEGEAGSFYYAEVEFASEAAAHAFAPPAYLGREVTMETGYTMAEYSRRKAGL